MSRETKKLRILGKTFRHVGLSHIRLTIHVGLVVKVAVQFSVPVVWKEIPHPATLVQDHYSSLCLSFNVDSPVGYSIQPCHCLSRHPKVMTLRSAQDSIGTVRDSISTVQDLRHIFLLTLCMAQVTYTDA